jgi:hypothetical protein
MSESAAGPEENSDHSIASRLDAIEWSLSRLAEVQDVLDQQDLSMAAIHVDQAIESLRSEKVLAQHPN